jgi:hypothetical protein
MPWAANLAVEPYSIPMDMSAGALAVMAVVVIICLGFLLIPVMLAGRTGPPHRTGGGPLTELTPGSAEHVGESRSVVRPGEGQAAPAPQTRETGSEGG